MDSLNLLGHWSTRRVTLGSLAATHAVLHSADGVIAWCESPEDAEQVAAALNDLRGAVSLTDEQWERILWWMHSPVPPGVAKDMDVEIIRSINRQREQS